MVVPVERLSSSEKIKKYTGNDLRLGIFDNKRTLIITGNNCKVKLNENNGRIKVIGDSCQLTVLRGSGNIEYIGNNGKIRLGRDVPKNDVFYVGNGGEITTSDYIGVKKLTKKIDCLNRDGNNNKFPKENMVNICNSSKVRCTRPVTVSDVHTYIPNIKICKHFTLEKLVKL